MEILEGLNDEQRRAVTHTTGPMLVVAGAGTGKTQVITRRIAYLIANQAAAPNQILALTFTERAAREMEERLYGLIGWESFQVPVMTFHAFGAELIGRYASHIGRSIRGGLINDNQKALLLLQHISEVELEYYNPGKALIEFLEGIVEYIGQLQNAGVTAEDYEGYAQSLMSQMPSVHPMDQAEQRDIAKLYKLYESVKEQSGTYDYHDQMMLPLEILQQRPNIIDRLRSEYRYVLVDEYQDTNAVQDQLLRSLVGPGGNIFAVGDDDQAIYGFRGAEIGNILGFADNFGLEEPIVLLQNYRSGQPVLDAAYRLIRHNDPERLEAKLGLNKQLQAQQANAEVRYEAYDQPPAELSGVLARIEADISAGIAPSDIAVLSATHAPLKALAKLMRVKALPFSLATAVNIFEQPEMLSLWYLLNWIDGRADEAAVSHVMLGRYLNWPTEDYQRLVQLANEQLVPLEEALALDSSVRAIGLLDQLAAWRTLARSETVSRVLFHLVFETDILERWRDEALRSARMVRVFEDLQRWLEQMQDYESVSADPTLTRYLAVFPKPPQLEVTEPVGDPDGVALLTVHAAKGLEFSSVYLINVTQRAWSKSSTRSREVPEAVRKLAVQSADHEFRRLFYVALTRAKQKIVVSSATKTNGGSKQMASPFIHETFGEMPTITTSNLESKDLLQNTLTKLQRFYPLQKSQERMKLPYEREGGWIELSVTGLAGYDFCPFEFYLEHGLRLLQPVGPQLGFGTVLHRVFEMYYRAKLAGDDVADLSRWHDALDEHWSDRGYERSELATQDKQLAHRTLDAFLSREHVAERVVKGVEIPIQFELPEFKLRLKGKIDAVFVLADGLSLRDYKTGRTKTQAERLDKSAKENFQLRTYALAAEKLGMGTVAEVVLDYVVTQVEGHATYSKTIMNNHEAKLGMLADRIRARDFAPAENGSHECAAIRYYGTGEKDDLAFELMNANEGSDA